ncbi:hypothetical protein [Methanobacterium sp.]|uniref:hypothetical protein n=1 Tax=Methanobacterium sp. TaxID=2164 RepID=UPI0031586C2B
MNTKFVGEWILSYCPLISLLFDLLDFEKCAIMITYVHCKKFIDSRLLPLLNSILT